MEVYSQVRELRPGILSHGIPMNYSRRTADSHRGARDLKIPGAMESRGKVLGGNERN
jgi:hypothetical protein